MKIIIIKTDLSFERVFHKEILTIKDLEKYVNGNIEYINLDNNLGCYIKENAKKDELSNVLATAFLYKKQGISSEDAKDYIAGDAVLVGKDSKYNDISLNDKQINELNDFVLNMGRNTIHSIEDTIFKLQY